MGGSEERPGRQLRLYLCVVSKHGAVQWRTPLDAGTLRVPIQSTYGLDQAGEALQAFGTAHTHGKLGLQMT